MALLSLVSLFRIYHLQRSPKLRPINGALDELPPDLKIVQSDEDGYLERDGYENPVVLSSGPIQCI